MRMENPDPRVGSLLPHSASSLLLIWGPLCQEGQDRKAGSRSPGFDTEASHSRKALPSPWFPLSAAERPWPRWGRPGARGRRQQGREEERRRGPSRAAGAAGPPDSRPRREPRTKKQERQQPGAGPVFLTQSAGTSTPPRKPRRGEPGTKRGDPHFLQPPPAAQGPRESARPPRTPSCESAGTGTTGISRRLGLPGQWRASAVLLVFSLHQ